MNAIRKETGVLFNGQMVGAIIRGDKTNTRRMFSPSLIKQFEQAAKLGECSDFIHGDLQKGDEKFALQFCPYGKPGDLIWVRETTYEKGDWLMPPFEGADSDDLYWSGSGKYLYAASDEKPKSGHRTWPSIFMKKTTARIWLEITAIKVERVQDISEESAKSEGVAPAFSYPGWDVVASQPSYKYGFINLWVELYGQESWDSNPWIFVYIFKKINKTT